MKLNRSMHALLSQVENETIPCMMSADYAIARHRDPANRPYWLMGSMTQPVLVRYVSKAAQRN